MNTELRFVDSGRLIGGWIQDSDDCIIYCPGLPQYVSRYHEIVSAAHQFGASLFVPRYSGTWESSGQFGLATSVETIKSTVDFVRQGAGSELFASKAVTWRASRILVIGFSYGALPALLCDRLVWKTVLIAPFTSVELYEGDNPGGLRRTIDFLVRAYPHVYRFNPNEFYSELQSISYPDRKPNLAVLSGRQDESVSSKQVDWLRDRYGGDYEVFEGGHVAKVNPDLLHRLFA